MACGALHALVTLAVRGAAGLLFTSWFLVLGLGVLAGRAAGLHLSARPWLGRATVNLGYLGSSLAVVLLVRHWLTAGT